MININITGPVRLSGLSWMLRSRDVSQATATPATQPFVKARSVSLAAPEISRSAPVSAGSWGILGHQAALPAGPPLLSVR